MKRIVAEEVKEILDKHKLRLTNGTMWTADRQHCCPLGAICIERGLGMDYSVLSEEYGGFYINGFWKGFDGIVMSEIGWTEQSTLGFRDGRAIREALKEYFDASDTLKDAND